MVVLKTGSCYFCFNISKYDNDHSKRELATLIESWWDDGGKRGENVGEEEGVDETMIIERKGRR